MREADTLYLMKLSEKEKSALSFFKKELKKRLGKDKIRLTLYGSKARGDFHDDSDIDILVVSEKLTAKKHQIISDLATDIFLETQIDVSPHIYSREEYQKLVSLQTPFMLSIQRDGIII